MKITNKDSEDKFLALADDIFVPTIEMRKLKQKFFYSWNQGPSKGAPTIAQVIETTKSRSIETWSRKPGFKEWFFNDQEAGQKLEYLFDIGLDALEALIISGERASDRLKAIELVAKLSQKIGKPEAQVKYLDEDIQGMNERQLDEYLRKVGVLGDGEKESKEE